MTWCTLFVFPTSLRLSNVAKDPVGAALKKGDDIQKFLDWHHSLNDNDKQKFAARLYYSHPDAKKVADHQVSNYKSSAGAAQQTQGNISAAVHKVGDAFSPNNPSGLLADQSQADQTATRQRQLNSPANYQQRQFEQNRANRVAREAAAPKQDNSTKASDLRALRGSLKNNPSTVKQQFERYVADGLDPHKAFKKAGAKY